MSETYLVQNINGFEWVSTDSMIMSADKSADQIQWNMQQVHQWMVPTSVPPSGKSPATQNDFPLDFYPQHIPTGDTYVSSTYDSSFGFVPMAPLQRAQTFAGMTDMGRIYSPQPQNSPLDYFQEGIEGFDDLQSIYSESPSSLMSSDGYGFGSDSYGYDLREESSRSSVSSYVSLPSPDLRQAPTSAPKEPGTEVDALMQTLEGTIASDEDQAGSHQPPDGRIRKHLCPISSCHKAFSQPTHLKIHLRSHTGEKPYTCSIPGCSASFSQLGNLRTHERRHRGEKPIRRSRAQSDPNGSSQRFECKLDGCRGQGDGRGKVFTQLGNLKAHMNKFHKDTLARLSSHFANDLGGDDLNILPEEEELKEYFKSLYRNCNKGIKGRGKGRRVEVVL